MRADRLQPRTTGGAHNLILLKLLIKSLRWPALQAVSAIMLAIVYFCNWHTCQLAGAV